MPCNDALLSLEEYTGQTKCTCAGHTQVQPHGGDVAGRTESLQCSMERPQISNLQYSLAKRTVVVSAQAHRHGTSSVSSLQSVRHSKVPLESVGPPRLQQTSSACIAEKPESSMAKEAWLAANCVASCRSQDVTNDSMLAASASIGSLCPYDV